MRERIDRGFNKTRQGTERSNKKLVEALTARDGKSILPYVKPSHTRIDSDSAPEFYEQLEAARERINGKKGVVIDFSDVYFISSKGWRAILDVYGIKRRLSEDPLFGKAKVVLFEPKESIAESLELVGMHKYFEIYPREK